MSQPFQTAYCIRRYVIEGCTTRLIKSKTIPLFPGRITRQRPTTKEKK